MTPERPYVAVTETHTGVVLLLGDRAYKVKKPVTFPFVDYATVRARAEACTEEVALNQRLAPDVYLGVGQLTQPGVATPEPVVVMRRLPDERRLSTLVGAGSEIDDELRRLAHVIAAFHTAAPVTAAAVEAAGMAATSMRWEANAAEMAEPAGRLGHGGASHAVLAAARRYLAGRGDLLEHRVAGGWARDGHGDLLADDIFCMADGPRVLDCLEFDERLRAGDVLADVAFLAMDLERLGRPDLGWRFLELHGELLADRRPASLAHHHVAYRAQVRAKVACLRAAAGAADAADQAALLLGIAARHLEAGTIRLLLVGGAPGTGKSTLAASIGGLLGAVVLRSDEVRKEVAGLPAGTRAPAAWGAGIYGPTWTTTTYRTLLDRAEGLLRLGECVVLDASWADPAWRDEARALAARTSVDLTELRCTAPVALAMARARARADARLDPSDADADIAAAAAERFAAWPEASDVSTDTTPEASVASAVAVIRAPRQS